MALFPKRRANERHSFIIRTPPVGSRKHRRWLVDNWQPAPITASQVASGGGGGTGGVLEQATPRVDQRHRGQGEGEPVWLLLPVGLLSLIVLVPGGIAA